MLHQLNLQVFPGDGLVARMPGVCIVTISRTAQQSSIAQHIVEVSRGTERGEEVHMIRRIAGSIVVAPPEDVPSFCLVAQHGAELVMMPHGALEAIVRRPSADERYSGDAVTWIERRIAPPFSAFEVGADLNFAPTPQRELDLKVGAVNGAG